MRLPDQDPKCPAKLSLVANGAKGWPGGSGRNTLLPNVADSSNTKLYVMPDIH